MEFSLYNSATELTNGFTLTVYVSDFALPIGFFLWYLVVKKTIPKEQRHSIAMFGMFQVFCLIAGTILVIILPAKVIGSDQTRFIIPILCAFFLTVSKLWGFEYFHVFRKTFFPED